MSARNTNRLRLQTLVTLSAKQIRLGRRSRKADLNLNRANARLVSGTFSQIISMREAKYCTKLRAVALEFTAGTNYDFFTTLNSFNTIPFIYCLCILIYGKFSGKSCKHFGQAFISGPHLRVCRDTTKPMKNFWVWSTKARGKICLQLYCKRK